MQRASRIFREVFYFYGAVHGIRLTRSYGFDSLSTVADLAVSWEAPGYDCG